jgi:type II restriction enzyme
MENKQSFENFIKSFATTNMCLDSITEFEKVKRNVAVVEKQLNALNYLLNKDDLEDAVNSLFADNPNCFKVIPILLAVRDGKKQLVLNDIGNPTTVADYLTSPSLILDFLTSTGLRDVFRGSVKNLVDYVFGVEVGLDSNARKNRGGSAMMNLVAARFAEAGIKYETEVKLDRFPKITTLGVDVKRFDFAVYAGDITYLVEVNFYNSGGSKLNETARSFKEVAHHINKMSNYQFVWITDGLGWLDAKNQLEEAYMSIPHTYNLNSLDNFISIVKTGG